MTPLVDTHSHPQSRSFDRDRDAVVARARAAGVGTLIVVGTDPPSNRAALAMARAGRDMWATIGFHPHDAAGITEADWEELAATATDPLVVALGEMGLDFFRNLSPHDVQQAVFRRQLDLCARLNMPAVVHSRNAEQATWDTLEPWSRQRRAAGGTEPFGVLHCYAYGSEAALRYAHLGWMISIPGTVTYPDNGRGRAVAAAVPLDHLVLETDCPYLTPQSRRRTRNEPAYMVETLTEVATLRGVPAADVARATTANAWRLFRLPPGQASESLG
ncbi:MAG: TatD family hydrolase [Dehalococcoidia bacterium]